MSTTPKSGAYALYSHLTYKAGRVPMFYTQFLKFYTMLVMQGRSKTVRAMVKAKLSAWDYTQIIKAVEANNV